MPLTGAESRAGGLFRQGYELAIRKKNAEGGMLLSKLGGARAKVELVLHDDRSDQRSVVSLTRRLIDRDQVDALLGTYSTTLSSAQASADQRVRRAYLGV